MATIVLDRGNIFVSQVAQELDRHLGIRLHPSTAYHPRTKRQSKIANKAWPGCLATKFESVDNLLGGMAPEFKSDGCIRY
ncbi:hypothetical protein PCANC_05118 [Puccinia coronata f. sp. avenae]|uniref:Integrase catalytic domain-containing protein n=1 Tax=Puccinia coronata f. sp. avenae TaxID=200324 RepID=A0A2N5W332_9BASI|nr:hypothetical protein PCANC_05118 [Puccinia coronata f. sp. avenae]